MYRKNYFVLVLANEFLKQIIALVSSSYYKRNKKKNTELKKSERKMCPLKIIAFGTVKEFCEIPIYTLFTFKTKLPECRKY